MGYKEICLISVMLLSLAYILPTNFFLIVALVISCILLHQTLQDSKQGRKEYKIWTSLLVLVIFTVISVFIFYKPILAICSIIFYVLQIVIYTLNKNQTHTENIVFEDNKAIEDETKIHTITVNAEDFKTLVQDEISDQLSKFQEIYERERIATEKIELYKRKITDMQETLEIQRNVSDDEIIKLRLEKEEYQKRTQETQKEALQAQEETSKLYQEMQQKIQESSDKEQKANENIEAYERKVADIKSALETHKDMSNNEIEKLRQEKEKYQKRAEETQKGIWKAQEETGKLHQEMQQKIQEREYKEKQTQKNVEKYIKLLSDKERELSNQKDTNMKQMEKIKEEIKEYEKLAESSEEDKVKTQKEKEQLSEQLNNAKEELQKTKKIASQKIEKRTKELEQRWNKSYSKLEFASGVIKNVNKNFEYNEFGDIEKVLNDISGAEDPHTLMNNRGKMNNLSEEDHIGFSIPSGFPCRVFYKLIRGSAREKKVLITKIVKHNDPRYGK